MPIKWDSEKDALLFSCLLQAQPINMEVKRKIIELWSDEEKLTMRALEQHITVIFKRAKEAGGTNINKARAKATGSTPKTSASTTAKSTNGAGNGAAITPKKRGRASKADDTDGTPSKKAKRVTAAKEFGEESTDNDEEIVMSNEDVDKAGGDAIGLTI